LDGEQKPEGATQEDDVPTVASQGNGTQADVAAPTAVKSLDAFFIDDDATEEAE